MPFRQPDSVNTQKRYHPIREQMLAPPEQIIEPSPVLEITSQDARKWCQSIGSCQTFVVDGMQPAIGGDVFVSVMCSGLIDDRRCTHLLVFHIL